MKKSKIFVIFIILLVIFSVAFFVYKNIKAKENAGKNYRTVKVKKADLEITILATGVIKALTQIDIKSEIGGKVISLPFKEGQVVSKGNIIAIIDDKQQKEQFTQSDEDFKTNFAQLEQNQIALDLQKAQTDLSISTQQKELQQAELDYEHHFNELQEQKQLNQTLIAEAKAKVETAKRQLEKSLAGSRKQEIEQKLETVNQYKATMDNNEKEYERQKELYKNYFVAKKDVDTAEQNFLVAQAQYNAAKADYDMTLEGTRNEDIYITESQLKEAKKSLDNQLAQAEQSVATKERQLETDLNAIKKARIALQQEIANGLNINMKEQQVIASQSTLNKSSASRSASLDQLSKTKILSPVDGIIINRAVAIGDVVASQTMSSAAGTTLMTIADLGEIYAEANIDESDLGKIWEKLPVTIKAAAYPKLKIDGIITYVAPQAVQVQQIPTFKIKIKILLDKIKDKDLPRGRSRNKLLFPGMSVDADIHVDQKSDVLQIPIETIWQKDGKDYVTVVTEKKELKDVEVTVGMRNNIMAEIINGLKEGEDIKIPEQKTPQDGK